MSISRILYFLPVAVFLIAISLVGGGCAQVGAISGGPKDTIPPKLIRAVPYYGSTNVTTNRITLFFDEYIDVQDLQQNLLISPVQNRNPVIITNSKSISIKFRDTLLPNTTYTINFGNAVRDVNEENIYHDLSYSFSTGPTLDSLTLGGKVLLAETGLVDTTILVLLYRNSTDSAVKKIKPNYITKVGKDGSFRFTHLPADSFRIYALKDQDGSKTYNALSEAFAFNDREVTSGNTNDILLFAYTQEKFVESKTTSLKTPAEKKLRASVIAQGGQDLLSPLEVDFNNPIKTIDTNKIYLTDTLFNRVAGVIISQDSTDKRLFLSAKWQAETPLVLIIEKEGFKDSLGNTLAKNDTVHFVTKKLEDYGNLMLHFTGLDLKKNPVLEFVVNNIIKAAYPLTSPEWSNKMFTPGEYSIRILFDTDKNGVWTPGDFSKKLQPEISLTLPQTLSVRADWDNESEINL